MGRWKPLPGVAQVAMQGGAYAAKAITRRAKGDTGAHAPFTDSIEVTWRSLGVPRRWPMFLACIFRASLHGWCGCFSPAIHRGVSSRLSVAVQWGFLYLTFNRGARLITGKAANKPVGTPEPLEEFGDESCDQVIR